MAMQDNRDMTFGAHIVQGHVAYRTVADILGLDYTSVDELLQHSGKVV